MSTASGARPNVAGERVSSPEQEEQEEEQAGSTETPTAETESAGETPAATEAGETPAATKTGEAAEPGTSERAESRRSRSASGQRATTRRVRLSMARVDPWSVMKISFLLSVAAEIAMVVATGVLWLVLSGLNVFSDLDRVIRDIQPVSAEPFSLMDYIGFARVISLAVVIGVINVILLTALSTLGAYLYNICSSLVGGVRMTLTDD